MSITETETPSGAITSDAVPDTSPPAVAPETTDDPSKTTAQLDAERQPTQYVILAYIESSQSWIEVTSLPAANQQDAKKKAVAENSVLREQLEKGHKVTLVAVARPSWKPTSIQRQVSENLVFS